MFTNLKYRKYKGSRKTDTPDDNCTPIKTYIPYASSVANHCKFRIGWTCSARIIQNPTSYCENQSCYTKGDVLIVTEPL